MGNRLAKLATYARLGLGNVARVGIYRIGLKTGLHPVLKISADVPQGPFLLNHAPDRDGVVASQRWRDCAPYFSVHDIALDGAPDWHANPFQGEGEGVRAPTDRPWFRVPDFDPNTGDVKTVWEMSRFEWVLPMAQRAALGDASELDRLNAWIADWLAQNPPYDGANWKCGQEASMRVMHLAMAAVILGQGGQGAPAGLIDLIALHLRRIAPTISYAIGQSNNHGTSEAAGLFIGGSWLQALGHPDGAKWARSGRRWLEERAQALIDPDGTFSQYSVVYHRVMLDTYSMVEIWRRHLDLPAFSPALHGRLSAATHWLRDMIMAPDTGDTPNLGANDGARLLALTDTEYRDFRPSVQLAAGLFCKARAIAAPGLWDQPALWLDLNPKADPLPPSASRSCDGGGFHILRQGDVAALLRYPRFRFRPSQSDLLHVDLWTQGRNLLRDGGTFSYNAGPDVQDYFSGVPSHNTIQFDDRDQMPRFGRFLFGHWPRALNVRPVETTAHHVTAGAAYRDYCGVEHDRTLQLRPDSLLVEDRISGFRDTAVLRWRLAPGQYHLAGTVLKGEGITITIDADMPIARIAIESGEESRYYLDRNPLPVLTVVFETEGCLRSRIAFHDC